MGAIKAAVGDAVLTAMWVFSASTLGALTSVIASAIGVQGMAALFITTVLIFLLVTAFGAAGAVGGALAIVEVMPMQYKHMLGGPSLKVDLQTGALAEGVLTFIITFAVLFIVLKGPRSPLLKTWLISLSTVVMIVTGSSYTGPSMNPANAFGWAYVNNRHNTWEQFYVYWICPFIGAILAAFVFRTVFPPPAKQKKA
ncbi:hypothetical protein RHMOL_Rhmol04G0118800 [Rhododendron molle]|uniref:Uncharacterized protein n=1 Tax=Rhododendron molle TaxID=49168 RepID=A0ACC0NZS5_RHOML|nr:hypothetical protein RHMOL_Rhmol04G0118800 [Rhododendron molle]